HAKRTIANIADDNQPVFELCRTSWKCVSLYSSRIEQHSLEIQVALAEGTVYCSPNAAHAEFCVNASLELSLEHIRAFHVIVANELVRIHRLLGTLVPIELCAVIIAKPLYSG